MRNDVAGLAELRLLHLSSPSLPLGSFAYSQGLEWAVAAGWIRNETELETWLAGIMAQIIAQLDVPVFSRCYGAWPDDVSVLISWERFLIASRETAELRQEELARGRALMRCLEQICDKGTGPAWRPTSFVGAYSFCTWHFNIAPQAAARGYVWSWLENQVMAAIRLIPLGQSAGQRVLFRLSEGILTAVETGFALEDDDIGASAPAQALAGALHETQYTRLFRS